MMNYAVIDAVTYEELIVTKERYERLKERYDEIRKDLYDLCEAERDKREDLKEYASIYVNDVYNILGGAND